MHSVRQPDWHSAPSDPRVSERCSLQSFAPPAFAGFAVVAGRGLRLLTTDAASTCNSQHKTCAREHAFAVQRPAPGA